LGVWSNSESISSGIDIMILALLMLYTPIIIGYKSNKKSVKYPAAELRGI
jgi:hypothetical protein